MSNIAKVTRGEKLLTMIANDGLISEQGKDWLVACLDPFHDHQLKNLAGWPDVQTGASVVRCVKQTVTIQVPGGVAGNWDAHIVQWPWITSNQNGNGAGNFAISAARSGNSLTVPSLAAPPANAKIGGLQIYYVQPGTNLAVTLNVATTQLIATLDMPQAYTSGVTRLIGMGFEVHNTTSQLNIQGSVLGYRQMANENCELNWTVSDALVPPSSCNWSGPFVRYPPANSAEALLLSGSRQWEAKDGIYSVAAFHTTENPATMISPVSPVIIGDGADDQEGTLATSVVNFPIPGPANAANIRGQTGFRVFNVHQSGAIFSGLSNSTTLTLNWNVFLETFPSASESQILPLATPSAQFDPDVLDLYSRVMVDLPVAVPVRENGLGDWFYDAVQTASKYIGPMLAMAPHPALKGLGTVMTGMSSVMEKDKKSKPVKALASATPPNSWGAPPRKPAQTWTNNPLFTGPPGGVRKRKRRSKTVPPPTQVRGRSRRR